MSNRLINRMERSSVPLGESTAALSLTKCSDVLCWQLQVAKVQLITVPLVPVHYLPRVCKLKKIPAKNNLTGHNNTYSYTTPIHP